MSTGLTSELLLREVTDGDISVFFAQQQDPIAIRMVGFSPNDPTDWPAFAAKWAKILGDQSTTARTITYGGHVAGNVLAFVAPWSGQLEVGYWLGREFWGRGVATQALVALLDQLPIRPVYARVAADNIASIRVLEKCGFVLISKERGFAEARNAEIEEVVMELRADAA